MNLSIHWDYLIILCHYCVSTIASRRTIRCHLLPIDEDFDGRTMKYLYCMLSLWVLHEWVRLSSTM